MKAKLTLEIEFESQFEPERKPETLEQWKEFFDIFLLPDLMVGEAQADEFGNIVFDGIELGEVEIKLLDILE